MPTACAAMSMRPPSTIVARDREPLVQPPEQVPFRHAAIAQQHVDRFAGAEPQHLVGLADREAGSVGLDDERRQAVAPLRRIGQRIDDGDARLAAARDEPLVAVEDEVVAVGDGGRPNRAGIGAGRRLGKRVAAELLPIGERREIRLFLRGVAVSRDGIADERIVDGDDGAERRPLFRNLDEAGHIRDEIVLAPEQARLRPRRR